MEITREKSCILKHHFLYSAELIERSLSNLLRPIIVIRYKVKCLVNKCLEYTTAFNFTGPASSD